MKNYSLIILLLYLLPFVYAYDVSITLNSNDIAVEKFMVEKKSGYDSYEFLIQERPTAVIYDGYYDLLQDRVILHDNLKDWLEFELIYPNMIEKSGIKRTFRVSFEGVDRLNVTLPEKFFLSKEPSTIPKYDSISTDGQKITLSWNDVSSIAIFYEGGVNYFLYIIIIFFFVLIILLSLFFYIKKHKNRTIDELISEDEKLILAQLKLGYKKQKDISKNLDFSKSKMSKVLRKLEEKSIIEKKPHFKTNIIKLK